MAIFRSAAALLALALILLGGPAAAHKASDSYLSLQVDADQITGQWDIAVRDLDYAIGLDGNGDGTVTWAELRASHTAIADYALAHLDLQANGQACDLQASDHLVDNHSDGAYAVLRFSGDCPGPFRSLAVAYSLFFELDRQHRGLLNLAGALGDVTAIFSPERSQAHFASEAPRLWQTINDYLREGVWHIWIGLDHVLFLLTLLLPAALLRQGGSWQAVDGFRPTFWGVLRIVTAFTVAHSITLSLAVLGLIALPTAAVEAAIAASVVLAALNNLYPLVTRRLWIAAFLFGLVHGLGFASVLQDLGLPRGALAAALLSFNLGVEIGQLAIVAAVLPLLYVIRSQAFYPRAVLPLGSVVVALVGSLWLAERGFGWAMPI